MYSDQDRMNALDFQCRVYDRDEYGLDSAEDLEDEDDFEEEELDDNEELPE